MYVINQNEPSKKFQDAWAVALRYLHHQGKGDINWLRIQLNLPMAEHLSFYMGNQLPKPMLFFNTNTTKPSLN